MIEKGSEWLDYLFQKAATTGERQFLGKYMTPDGDVDLWVVVEAPENFYEQRRRGR